MHFTYCPHCGSKLISKEIGDEGFIPYCESCEIPLWDMFTTSIITAVVNEYREIALLRQNYVSTTNYVCVAGIMKPGESAEETVIREVKEELGVDISNAPYAFVGSTTRYFKNCPDIVDVYIFELDVSIENVVIQKEEVNDVKWMTKEEIMEIYNQGNFETTKFILEVLNFDRKLNNPKNI